MLTVSRAVLAALALVSLFTGSAHAAGISNARLFGRGEVFKPTQDLLGQPSCYARSVGDLNHCDHVGLSFPGKRLIALDNDGVLIPINADYYDKQSARDLLEELGRNPNNEVWVVSARSLSSLRQQYYDIPGVNLAAEHGTILEPYGEGVQAVSIDKMREIREAVEAQLGLSIFDTQNVVAFKYSRDWYRTADAHAALDEVQRILPPHIPLRQEEGKAYGEIKDYRIEKANFVAKLLHSGRFRSGIAMGDQSTDEGMFRAMNNHGFHSVIVSQVSSQQTRAQSKLDNVHEVHQLLRQLI